MTLIEFPANAKVAMTITKEKIYGKAGVKTALRERFIREVKKIVWLYKLAPETINIAETKEIREIQVFSIELRTDELHDDILRCLDTAIEHPILFLLRREEQTRMLAALKRINEADESKRVLSGYFKSGWVADETPRIPLPFANNLAVLYDNLLRPLIPYPARQDETLRQHVERAEKIEQKNREIGRLEARIRKPMQFNRMAEINGQIHRLEDERDKLTSTS